MPGRELVNKDDPQVIEIWNIVFMQYERKADGHLEPLGMNVIDTGMGFERLVRAIQGKQSNYDTDVFQPTIQRISAMSGKAYGEDEKTDVAMRVIADHLRAISFSIADGQLPSNVKAGYVIRRILRRAVRYGYTYLGFNEPFICRLVPTLVAQMGEQIIRHYVELRGIGIVDVRRLFGMGAVKMTERIDLIINLETWIQGKMYDRLGLDEETTNILGLEIPSITIPVKPGRNLAIILEIAAIVHDIACPLCREKYGRADGYLQEQESELWLLLNLEKN